MAESEFKPRMETSGKGPHLSETQFFVLFSLFFLGGGFVLLLFLIHRWRAYPYGTELLRARK